jgi:hypothetical protein
MDAGRQFKGLSWDHVVTEHPEMAEHEDAVNYLAHATPSDPEAESSMGVANLSFEHRNVPLRSVRNASDPGNPRTSSAMAGYSGQRLTKDEQTHSVPPVLLVKRGRNYEVADGHHRAEAAKRYGSATHINAVVTRSPTREPFPKHD